MHRCIFVFYVGTILMRSPVSHSVVPGCTAWHEQCTSRRLETPSSLRPLIHSHPPTPHTYRESKSQTPRGDLRLRQSSSPLAQYPIGTSPQVSSDTQDTQKTQESQDPSFLLPSLTYSASSDAIQTFVLLQYYLCSLVT